MAFDIKWRNTNLSLIHLNYKNVNNNVIWQMDMSYAYVYHTN